MKYKVQYVNGKMAEFEADDAEVVEIGSDNWLLLRKYRYGRLLGWLGIGIVPVATARATAFWKVTTEEANETLVEEIDPNRPFTSIKYGNQSRSEGSDH